MILYAESSAVLSWLLSEPDAPTVRESLLTASQIIASEITLVECDRVLIRATATEQLPEAEATDRRAVLAKAAAHWTLISPGPEVLERMRRPFPREPIRTLDSLHLASALLARSALPELRVLTLDRRIRQNARELGFEVLPKES